MPSDPNNKLLDDLGLNLPQAEPPKIYEEAKPKPRYASTVWSGKEIVLLLEEAIENYGRLFNPQLLQRFRNCISSLRRRQRQWNHEDYIPDQPMPNSYGKFRCPGCMANLDSLEDIRAHKCGDPATPQGYTEPHWLERAERLRNLVRGRAGVKRTADPE